jgi:hypothetical protein
MLSGCLMVGVVSQRGSVPAGLPFNVAQLYMRMAEGIRERKSVSPDFDVAVKRHQVLDVIQKADSLAIILRPLTALVAEIVRA